MLLENEKTIIGIAERIVQLVKQSGLEWEEALTASQLAHTQLKEHFSGDVNLEAALLAARYNASRNLHDKVYEQVSGSN